jgi:hypothetical protein
LPPGDPEIAAPPNVVSGFDRQPSADCNYARQCHLLAHNGISVVEAFGIDGSVRAKGVCRISLAPAVLDGVRTRAVTAQLDHGLAVTIHHRGGDTEALSLARFDGGRRNDFAASYDSAFSVFNCACAVTADKQAIAEVAMSVPA